MIPHSNRGMIFENIIETQNEVYRHKGFGVVQKIATPTKTYQGRTWREKSTVDFLGFLSGLGVAFDAKECRDTHFPLKHIQPHQIKFLRDAKAGGAISFILLNMIAFNRVYLIPLNILEFWIDKGEKSLKRKFFNLHPLCVVSESNRLPNYLETIKKIKESR